MNLNESTHWVRTAFGLMVVALSLAGCSDIKNQLGGNDAQNPQAETAHEDHPEHEQGVHAHEEGSDDDHAEHGEEGHDDHDDPGHGETGHAHEEHSDDDHAGHGEEEGHDENESGVVHFSQQKLEGLNITVVPVHAGSVESTLALPMEIALDPDNVAHVVPRTRGIVKSIHVGIGDVVEEGQVLAVLESRELGTAKSEYLAALAMGELARTTFLREQKLWEDKISAEQDFLQAKAGYQAAQITVDTAEQALHTLGVSQAEVDQLPRAEDSTLTRHEILAPFGATVIERHVTLGETVGDDDAIFYIAALDPVWALGQAAERDIRRIQNGQQAAVQIDALPGEEFQGQIDYIGSVLDSQSRTVNVRVVLPNPDARLRAGLFGRMLLFIDQHGHDEAFLVPNGALQRTQTGAIVYKETGPGEFKAVAVSVLHSSSTHTEVQGELAEGDRVASGDIFVLKSEAGKESMGGGHSH